MNFAGQDSTSWMVSGFKIQDATPIDLADCRTKALAQNDPGSYLG